MQLMKLLHKSLKTQLPFIHQSRLKNLIYASEALIRANKLTLTSLGRNLSNQNKTRSNIKKMDRLLGNSLLANETHHFYKVMASNLIKEGTHPWLHIDWSCICSITNLYLLRASLSMPGRSIVIYEECHPKKNENHHPTHKIFLNRLKTILPASVKPIIVTDAGFRAPWFIEVKALGWDFVGRLRHKNLVRFNDKLKWQLSGKLYPKATLKPNYLGPGILTEKLKVPAHFVLFKGKKKSSSSKRKYASRNKRYIRAHKEPWLLVTSLLPSKDIASKTVKIYYQRMRIEENFRDSKCTRYGFGLKESRTRSPERMKILLLISALATFACWLAAIVTRQAGMAADYQAHSSKFKSVLSWVYLGREALKKRIKITTKQFTSILLLMIHVAESIKLECP